MRVLYWTQLFWPSVGGVEVLGTKFLPAMHSRGYDFTVVTSHSSFDLPDEDHFEGIPIYRLPFHVAIADRDLEQSLVARKRLIQLKKSFRPHLVHINFTDPSIFFHWQTINAYPSPTLVAIRLALPDRPSESDTLLSQTFQLADWLTANSQAILSDLQRLAPAIRHKSSVIYNGLEMPDLKSQPLSFTKPRLLCLGRVVDDKGFDIALRALPKIVMQIPGTRLLIGGDGPALPKLKRLSEDLNITNLVDFKGWISPENVPELINSSCIVIVPSRWREAFGLVALQAAQMARPVIATRVGGLPEVVKDKETGWLVPKEDSDELAKAVIYLLRNPEIATEMGRKGRQRAERVFSLSNYVDEYDALYKNLIKGGVRDVDT